MKHAYLNQVIFGVLLLMATVVNAEQYPAADFQPKVLFRDESVVVVPAAASPASTPVAPCVSQEATHVGNQAVAPAEVDPKYPASSFQPKVLFSQTN